MTGFLGLMIPSPAMTLVPSCRARLGLSAFVGCALACILPLSQSAAAQTSQAAGGVRPAPSRATATPTDVDPALSRSVAARSRMLECGHQWSAMKKAGTAVGTWREFSRICLAQR